MASKTTIYSRGWETFAHWLLMLRVSIMRNFAWAALLSLTLGGGWFAVSLGPDGRGSLAAYTICYGHSTETAGELSKVTNKVPAGPPAGRCAQLAAVFGGRSFTFLLRQFCGLWIATFLITFVLIGYIITSSARRLEAGTTIRGGRLLDMRNHVADRRIVLATRAVAMGTALSMLVFALGIHSRLEAFPTFVKSWLLRSLPISRFFYSPSSDSGLAWFDIGDTGGFYNMEAVYQKTRELFWNVGLGVFVLGFLVLATLLSLAAAAFLWRRDALNEKNGPKRLAGIALPEARESSHWLFCGSTGAGKSVAIKELLDQVRERGERAIVYDTSGEYIESFYRHGIDHILNPLDARSEAWDIWADVNGPEDFLSIARSLFPSGGKDAFWHDASASVFAETAKKLSAAKREKNSELTRVLTSLKLQDLSEMLDGTPAARFVEPDAGNMPTNVIATITSKLASFAFLQDAKDGQQRFSVREFITRPEESDPHAAWLFLSTKQSQHEVLKPLISMWCDQAATAILSRPPGDNRRVWVILDEVASMQKLPALSSLLERGRKHGAAVVLGLQAMPQLREIYGNEAAAALAAQPQNWLVLRTVEPSTAEWLSQALGQVEVEETRESISMGADSHRDGVSISTNSKTKPLVMASEIINLPTLEGFLSLTGYMPVCNIKYTWRDREKIAEGFDERRALPG